MSHIQRMIETNPSPAPVDAAALAKCIQACFECTQACTACADACLGEQDIQMLVTCIRLDLDCADLCTPTRNILSRQTAFAPEMARAALEACRRCGQACSNVLSAISA